jgi:hypothetical protein
MTEKPASNDRQCLDHRERTTASPADVPGTALCIHNLPAGLALRTMPMPGNPVPSRSKQSFRQGGRPPTSIGMAAHPLRPQSGGRADGRRWTAFAIEANAVQKAGAPEQRQRHR